MPVTTEQPTRAFAFCQSALCGGYMTSEVDAIRVEHGFTYGDDGETGPLAAMVERSTTWLRFINEADEPCPECQKPRQLSATPRPSYAPMSGHDPMALATGSVPQYDPRVVNTPADEEVAALKAQMAQMQATLEKALAKEGDD